MDTTISGWALSFFAAVEAEPYESMALWQDLVPGQKHAAGGHQLFGRMRA